MIFTYVNVGFDRKLGVFPVALQQTRNITATEVVAIVENVAAKTL